MVVYVFDFFSHSVTVTDLLLKNLTTHEVLLRIWEGKEKVNAKAKTDRPKGFRILKSGMLIKASLFWIIICYSEKHIIMIINEMYILFP